MASSDQRFSVFLSYSHKDNEVCELVATHLRVLQNAVNLRIFSDREIAPGADLDPEIMQAMTEADLAILLVSAHYLTSPYVTRVEIPTLLKRREKEGLRIIPFIVRQCPWKNIPWLSSIKAMPEDGRPLKAMSEAEKDEHVTRLASEVVHEYRNRNSPANITSQTPGAEAPPRVSVLHMPSTGPLLVGRAVELQRLDELWKERARNIAVIVGWGGCGKSALLNHWLLRRMVPDAFRGARRVFAWSFYSQGINERLATTDAFFEAAMSWFGVNDYKKLDPWDRGARLADAIRAERTLLILDGMEPVQHGPGMNEGKIKDPALSSLVKSLSFQNNGLCIISTRVPVVDLSPALGATVDEINLQDLAPAEGSRLLDQLGVHGSDEDRQRCSMTFGGHALALTLLASYLVAAHAGDVKCANEVPLLKGEQRPDRQALRVLQSYEEFLGPGKELCVLKMLSTFDRPTEFQVLWNMRTFRGLETLAAPIAGLTPEELRITIARLRRLHLLLVARESSTDDLDMHPLVRTFFAERCRAESVDRWRIIHESLFHYYVQRLPRSLETIHDIGLGVEAIIHGCEAGLYKEALHDLLKVRILKKKNLVHALAVPSLLLVALGGFFRERWIVPVSELELLDQGYVLNDASIALDRLGRTDEAIRSQEAAAAVAMGLRSWTDASIAKRNLAQYLQHTGRLEEAYDAATESLQLAKRAGGIELQVLAEATVATTEFLRNHNPEARKHFHSAEKLLRRAGSQNKILRGREGWFYSVLLIDEGYFSNAENRLTLLSHGKESGPATQGLVRLASVWLTVRQGATLDKANAIQEVVDSIAIVRSSSERVAVVNALLLGAKILAFIGDAVSARWLADEARLLSEDSNYTLLLKRAHDLLVSLED